MKKEMTQDAFLRKRAERQRKIRRRRLKIFFTLFVVFLMGLSVVLCLTVFFPIENINIKGSEIYTEAKIIKASGIEIGDNLFATAKGTVLKKLKAKLPYIEDIEFERELPGSLTVKVKDAGEYACYFDGKSYYTVSNNGWVLKKEFEAAQNVFTVYGAKVKCKVGTALEFSDENTKELTEKIIMALSSEELLINRIDITDTVTITVNVEDRFEVNLGTANYITEKVKHLASMIDNIAPEKSGKINLSMWTNANTQGTFVEQINE